MISIRSHPKYLEWQNGLKDAVLKGAIAARIQRLQRGSAGDSAPVGEGVSELRFHLGSGWRIYYIRHGQTIIILLGGGTKKTQIADIKEAKKRARDFKD